MKQPVNQLTEQIIGCAIEVHRHLGPGMLESAYQKCLEHELSLKSISFTAEVPMPVRYKGELMDCGYRLDFLIENQVIVELKSVEKILPVHHAQLLSYMRMAGVNIGLLINFNVKRLIDGIKRMKH
jgi:GxxExxY protein